MIELCHLAYTAAPPRFSSMGFNRKHYATILVIVCLIAGPLALPQQPAPSPASAPANDTKAPTDHDTAAQPPPDAPPATDSLTDAGWPRIYTDGTATITVHQPQVDDWKDFKILTVRAAVEIVPKKGTAKLVAAAHLEAETDANLEDRTVLLRNFRFTSFRIPGKEPSEVKALEELAFRLLPERQDAVALDRILAYLSPETIPVKRIEISTEAPTIVVSTRAAILVMIDGQPILGDIPGTKLSFLVNTNWDIVKEKGKESYYLLNEKQWLTAKTLDGPWSPAKKLPKDTKKIPNDENWADVTAALPLSKGNKDSKAPQVFVSYKPSELIQLKGEPQFKPIEGTAISEVTNTESQLLYHNGEKTYYFLTSGRWFRNQQLRGVWEYASDKLPPDFQQIPKDHPRAIVLPSVPGTVEAADAVLLASVPQMAVVNRKEAAAQAKVSYIGPPQFKPIENTALQYAVNTPGDVIKFENSYYLLQQGVWFSSSTPNGPWAVADTIPQEIYKIPPESPKHNTTYVYITDSDSQSVTTAQTAGYMGMTVGASIGVVVWGTGYYYPPYYYYGPMYPYPVYWGYPYHSYGAAAWYNPATGFYGRAAVAYGPYGGYGRAAAYNPATGSYVRRSGAYGPYQAAMGTSFYNPRTGAWGGGYRYANPYQGWGEGVVHRGDQWAKGGYYYDDRGAVGGIRTSEGGRLVAAGDGDNSGFVGRTSDGDLYAGKDGEIYRRDENGNWQQRGDGNWSDVNRDNLSQSQQQRLDQASSQVQSSDRATQARERAGNRTQSGTASASTLQNRAAGEGAQIGQAGQSRPSAGQTGTRQIGQQASSSAGRTSRDMSSLNRDASARSRGNSNYSSWRNSSSARSSSMRGRTGGRTGGRRR